VEAQVGLEQIRDAARAGDCGEGAENGERRRRLGHVAARHEGAEDVARQRVVHLRPEPLLEADRVELRGTRVLPRRVRVDLGRDLVQLRDGAVVCPG
jgi:hypothetical protein